MGCSTAPEALCDQCERPFKRVTSESVCPDCLAPLCRLRKEAGLTQAALAARVGCGASTIIRWERDQDHPQLKFTREIARVLNLDIPEIFPNYAVTGEEAAGMVGTIRREIEKLFDAYIDRSDYWHRVPYVLVVALRLEREEFLAEWISFNAAATEYKDVGLERWVIKRWVQEGQLTDCVGDGRVGRLGSRFVRRDQLRQLIEQERAAQRTCANEQCSTPDEPLLIGRLAHARCVGPLAVRAFWDALTEERREEHRQAIQEGLAVRRTEAEISHWFRWFVSRWSPDERHLWELIVRRYGERSTPQELAQLFLDELGGTRAFGYAAAEIARENHKHIGMPEELIKVTPEKHDQILKLASEQWSDGRRRHSQRRIAELVGVSRGSVRHLLDQNKVG
jgi:DNA-binding XRE family transcriptional regulator